MLKAISLASLLYSVTCGVLCHKAEGCTLKNSVNPFHIMSKSDKVTTTEEVSPINRIINLGTIELEIDGKKISPFSAITLPPNSLQHPVLTKSVTLHLSNKYSILIFPSCEIKFNPLYEYVYFYSSSLASCKDYSCGPNHCYSIQPFTLTVSIAPVLVEDKSQTKDKEPSKDTIPSSQPPSPASPKKPSTTPHKEPSATSSIIPPEISPDAPSITSFGYSSVTSLDSSPSTTSPKPPPPPLPINLPFSVASDNSNHQYNIEIDGETTSWNKCHLFIKTPLGISQYPVTLGTLYFLYLSNSYSAIKSVITTTNAIKETLKDSYIPYSTLADHFVRAYDILPPVTGLFVTLHVHFVPSQIGKDGRTEIHTDEGVYQFLRGENDFTPVAMSLQVDIDLRENVVDIPNEEWIPLGVSTETSAKKGAEDAIDSDYVRHPHLPLTIFVIILLVTIAFFVIRIYIRKRKRLASYEKKDQ